MTGGDVRTWARIKERKARLIRGGEARGHERVVLDQSRPNYSYECRERATSDTSSVELKYTNFSYRQKVYESSPTVVGPRYSERRKASARKTPS